MILHQHSSPASQEAVWTPRNLCWLWQRGLAPPPSSGASTRSPHCLLRRTPQSPPQRKRCPPFYHQWREGLHNRNWKKHSQIYGPIPLAVVLFSQVVLGKYILTETIMNNVMKVFILDTIKLFLLVKYWIKNK